MWITCHPLRNVPMGMLLIYSQSTLHGMVVSTQSLVETEVEVAVVVVLKRFNIQCQLCRYVHLLTVYILLLAKKSVLWLVGVCLTVHFTISDIHRNSERFV